MDRRADASSWDDTLTRCSMVYLCCTYFPPPTALPGFIQVTSPILVHKIFPCLGQPLEAPALRVLGFSAHCSFGDRSLLAICPRANLVVHFLILPLREAPHKELYMIIPRQFFFFHQASSALRQGSAALHQASSHSSIPSGPSPAFSTASMPLAVADAVQNLVSDLCRLFPFVSLGSLPSVVSGNNELPLQLQQSLTSSPLFCDDGDVNLQSMLFASALTARMLHDPNKEIFPKNSSSLPYNLYFPGIDGLANILRRCSPNTLSLAGQPGCGDCCCATVLSELASTSAGIADITCLFFTTRDWVIAFDSSLFAFLLGRSKLHASQHWEGFRLSLKNALLAISLCLSWPWQKRWGQASVGKTELRPSNAGLSKSCENMRVTRERQTLLLAFSAAVAIKHLRNIEQSLVDLVGGLSGVVWDAVPSSVVFLRTLTDCVQLLDDAPPTHEFVTELAQRLLDLGNAARGPHSRRSHSSSIEFLCESLLGHEHRIPVRGSTAYHKRVHGAAASHPQIWGQEPRRRVHDASMCLAFLPGDQRHFVTVVGNFSARDQQRFWTASVCVDVAYILIGLLQPVAVLSYAPAYLDVQRLLFHHVVSRTLWTFPTSKKDATSLSIPGASCYLLVLGSWNMFSITHHSDPLPYTLHRPP